MDAIYKMNENLEELRIMELIINYFYRGNLKFIDSIK